MEMIENIQIEKFPNFWHFFRNSLTFPVLVKLPIVPGFPGLVDTLSKLITSGEIIAFGNS